jgi:hypothetical protein
MYLGWSDADIQIATWDRQRLLAEGERQRVCANPRPVFANRRMRSLSRLQRLCTLVLTIVTVIVIGLAAMPTVTATQAATEEVINIRPTAVTTLLTVPAQAHWETDPDAGPLSLTVETGALGVNLGGGLARIERRPDPLLGGDIGPVRPGRQVVLRPGDRLVIVHGFQLTAINDTEEPARAIVVRLRHAS